jgi:hypothetical protein
MNTEQRLERRPTQRFAFHLPVSVRVVKDGRETCGFTQDLSAKGIFFYSELAVPTGEEVELTLMMPSEVTLAESMRVRCRGKVVRTTPANGGSARGAAIRVEGYEFLAEPETLPHSSEVVEKTTGRHEHAAEPEAAMAGHNFGSRSAIPAR